MKYISAITLAVKGLRHSTDKETRMDRIWDFLEWFFRPTPPWEKEY